jgi:valyl-tRNA synthetase
LADKILEESKQVFQGTDEEAKKSRERFLQYALQTILKALHPFMPFVTEEIWQLMNAGEKSLLMVENWPN